MFMANQPKANSQATRRDFLKATAVAGTAMAAGLGRVYGAHTDGSDTIRVGLIGCGGRGKGAAENVLHAAPGVKVVALADVFDKRVHECREHLADFARDNDLVKKHGNSVDLPSDRCFTGLDAYEKVLNCGVDYVILATPPGFRPQHLEAAVAAGKNIFTEKPVAVDGPGIRKVLTAYDQALEKKLAIVAGTQRRHQYGYLETMKRIKDGAIGELVGGRGYWMQGILWKRKREPEMSDVAYQIHNWYGFPWLSGDHIVEQHVHNLDVLNWAFGTHPVRAVGMGFRTRTDEGYGNIYDFFSVDFEFPNHVHALSMCRQISNCENGVAEYLVGTKGRCHTEADKHLFMINDDHVVSREQSKESTNPYVQEHTDLIASIRAGKPLNELKTVAESTLTAIMGRMSAYTGKPVTWDDALYSKDSLVPDNLDWNGTVAVRPVAIPGKTPLL
jgi:predicted dehydrogenase